MEGGCIVGCQLVLLMHPGQSARNGLHCITTSPADWPHTTTCEISFRRAFQLWFPKQQYLHSGQFNLGDLRGVSPPKTSRLITIRLIVNKTALISQPNNSWTAFTVHSLHLVHWAVVNLRRIVFGSAKLKTVGSFDLRMCGHLVWAHQSVRLEAVLSCHY